MIAEGVNLLIVAPNEAHALTPAVERAYKQGIPIVVVDRKIASQSYTAFVGADNCAIGRDAASYVARELGGKGLVAEFTGGMGATAAQERHNGFADELSHEPSIRLLPPLGGDWEGKHVQQQLDSLFAHGQVPDIIFAHNDRIGVKIHQAALERGHHIKVIGVDALSTQGGGLQNVERGELTATFVYPTGGYEAMRTAITILRRKPYERTTLLGTACVDSMTARIFRLQSGQISEREAQLDGLDGQIDDFLSRIDMQRMLLTTCIVIIVLIGIILAVGLRVYHATRRRNALLATQKHQLENQTTQLAAQKQKLETQRDELVTLSKQLEESTQSKLTFFTSVSHDLRTPLTLIMAPIEQLRQANNLTAEQHSLLNMVSSNAQMLLRLVNQTLDFRKFESGQLQLQLTETNLSACLKEWCEPFRSVAQRHMVRYIIDVPDASTQAQGAKGYMDKPKMESVLYNLLSNAFKYTPDGGRVTLTATIKASSEQGRRLQIVVANTGRGIAADKIEHVFDRFYQAEPSNEGSGIGLATVKTYVELHGGTVKAMSDASHGTQFTVTIPYPATQTEAQYSIFKYENEKEIAIEGKTKASTEVKMTDKEKDDADNPNNKGANNLTAAAKDATEAKSTLQTANALMSESNLSTDERQKPSILVIDDNADIRSYIELLLGADYEVRGSNNGQEGLVLARQLMPDAVVCDVMMPVMDGWECCRRLKDEWQTSHIPVMMLTACARDEQRIEGFDCGADAYLSKPFSPEVFKARLRNLLSNRQRLRIYFGDHSMGMTQQGVSELDKGFAERFHTLLEKNMGKAELSVEDLAAGMGLGRTQLYRKVKALTGYSPIELLRMVRIKKAAQLLRRTDKTVAEVAYEVGFSTPSYLTRCFHEYFGQSPSDYAKG